MDATALRRKRNSRATLCQLCAMEFLSRRRNDFRKSRNSLVLNSSPLHNLRMVGKEWKSPLDERQPSDLTGLCLVAGVGFEPTTFRL
jgi:hypothetical protein